MKPKKLIVSIALTTGLCISTLLSCNANEMAKSTGSFVGDSHSLVKKEITSYQTKQEDNRYLDVLKNPQDYSESERITAAMIYLEDKDISLDSLKDVFDNIIVFHANPMGIDEDAYKAILGPISQGLPQDINGFEAFYSLAYNYHLSICNQNHEGVLCDNLKALWSSINACDLESLLDQRLENEDTYIRIKAIVSQNTSLNMTNFINELIALNFITPSSPISEESLRNCFPNLAIALNSDENMLDTFSLLGNKICTILDISQEKDEEIYR